jgi:hypothetical protein
MIPFKSSWVILKYSKKVWFSTPCGVRNCKMGRYPQVFSPSELSMRSLTALIVWRNRSKSKVFLNRDSRICSIQVHSGYSWIPVVLTLLPNVVNVVLGCRELVVRCVGRLGPLWLWLWRITLQRIWCWHELAIDVWAIDVWANTMHLALCPIDLLRCPGDALGCLEPHTAMAQHSGQSGNCELQKDMVHTAKQVAESRRQTNKDQQRLIRK